MPSLRDGQARFLDALAGADDRAFAPLVEGPASIALQIHRNNVLGALAGALARSYPATRALLGEAFFDQEARRYAVRHLPGQAWLTGWGEGFTEFVANHPATAAYTWLGDVMRLDWAVERALFAPSPPSGSGEDAPLHLSPLPSLSLLEPGCPADRLRRAALDGGAGLDEIDMAEGPCRLAVYRLDETIEILRLDEEAARLLKALQDGRSLAEAVEGIDPARASQIFTAFLDGGLLSWRVGRGEA